MKTFIESKRNDQTEYQGYNSKVEPSKVKSLTISRIIPNIIFSVNEWTEYSNNNSYFYHYTSIKNAETIVNQKTIKANTPKIIHLGRCVFFTAHPPCKDDRFLIENNYIYYTGLRSKYNPNVECAFAISQRDISLIKVYTRDGRDVWKVKGDIDLKRITFELISRKNNWIIN